MQTPTSESDLIDRLVRHGLGQGEARCYVGMLAPRAFKVSEVAGEAGLPRSRTYELIRSLVRSGLCTEVAGAGAARFRAVPPNEAIGRLEAFLAERAARRNAALASILQALNGHGALRRDSEHEPVAMLRRRDQVFDAFERAIREAREEVSSVAPLTWEPRQLPAIAERAGAGVRFRTVHDRAILDSPEHLALIGRSGPAFQSRVLDRAEILFSLIDRRTVFLNLTVPSVGVPTAQMESLQIRHDGLGQTLHEAFERLWERAVPIEQALEAAGLPAPDSGRPAGDG
jgi:sugar-specific transcriptional regulator TrmB